MAGRGHLAVMHSAGRPSRRSPKSARCVPHAAYGKTAPPLPPRRRQRARRRLGHRGPRTRVQHWGKTDRAKAEKALGDHIAGKYRRSFREGHPDQVLIVDALAEYGERHASTVRRRAVIGIAIDKLAAFWKTAKVSAITPAACSDYVAWRSVQTDGHAKTDGRPGETSTAPSRCRKRGQARSDAGAATGAGRAARAPPDPGRDGALGWDAKGKRHHARINRHLARFSRLGLCTGTARRDPEAAMGANHVSAAGSTSSRGSSIAGRRTRSMPASGARPSDSPRGSSHTCAAGVG